jgi:hypothetical protein
VRDSLVALGSLAFVAITAILAKRWVHRRRSAGSDALKPVDFSGRTRTTFLERVWAQRIVNGLERSLQHAAEMQLGLRNTPELVQLSYAESTAEPGEMMTIERAYEQAGGQLAILGPPGAGKTTEALKLMRHLLEAARQDPTAPVPEMFPLASWARQRKPLLDWLADQLQLRHGYAPSEGRYLVWNHCVVPVLDGLDEVDGAHRARCVQEFNRFWDTYRGGPAVVCSRRAEYEQIPERLKLGGGVIVCAPDAEQVDQYLAAAGADWEPARAQLRGGSSILREVLTTPLMLSIAVLAYRNQDHNPLELSEAPDATTCRRRLWSQYVSAMTTRGYHPARTDPPHAALYTEGQVRRWLGWLAGEMRSRNETELWLHDWYGSPAFLAKVRVAIGAVLGLALGLVLGLGKGLRTELILGLGVSLLSALILGLSSGRIIKPEPAYRVPFDRRRLAVALLRGAGAGGGLGLALGGFGPPASVDGIMLLFALAVGLVFALVEWPLKPALAAHASFDQPSLVDRLLVGLLVGFFVVLVGKLGGELIRALGGGLLFGLFVGWSASSSPVYRGSSHRRHLAMTLISRFFLGMFVALAFGLVVAMFGTLARRPNGLIIGGIVGVIIELLFGLVSSLISFGPDRERLPPNSPTQSISDSARIGLVLGSIFGVATGVAIGAATLVHHPRVALMGGISCGLVVGLGFGLAFGLDSLVCHFAFRLWLRARGNGPFNWPRFLRWACDHLLLRLNGASYNWVHLELRDHLATQERWEGLSSGGQYVGPPLENLPG